MVRRVVSPFVAPTAPPVVFVVVADVGLRPTPPLWFYPFPALLVSALLTPAPPSLAPLATGLGLCLALPV